MLGTTLAVALVTRQKTASIPPHSNGSVTAKCPRGKQVVLGGFHNTVPATVSIEPQTLLTGLRRTPSGRGWNDSAADNASGPADATSIAYCGHGRDLKAHTKTVDVPRVTSSSTPPTSATATCPRGQRVALGGIAADFDPTNPPSGPDIFVTEMRRTSQRHWSVSGLNLGGGASVGELTAIAYCGKAPRTLERQRTVSIPSEGTRGHVTAKCPKGKRVAFGGFRAAVTYTEEFLLLDALERTSGRRWRAEAVNVHVGADQPGDLTAFAYCA